MLAALLGIVVLVAGGNGLATHPPGGATYTTTADFNEWTLLNLTTANDELKISDTIEPFPFVYIAASARGTMIKIDVDDGTILGEYFSAPNGMGRNPSRTTVDQFGNVWFGNRDEFGGGKGSIARVGLVVGGMRADADGTPNPTGQYVAPPFDYNTCVDRDGDGLLKTSNGLGNILPWTNMGGADSNGGVSTAADECIINYTRVTGTGTRTIAVDASNDIWVGGVDNDHEKVSGTTGMPIAGTQFNFGCGGYGGLVNPVSGYLFSARFGTNLLVYNPGTGTGVCKDTSHGDYGLGVDPATGEVWHSNLGGNRIAKLSPTGTFLAAYSHGEYYAQGVAVDGSGNVWVAHSLIGPSTTVGHLRTDGTFVGNVALPGGSGPTGVAIDANGKVWVANIYSDNAMRIDPNAGPIGGGGFNVGAVDLTVGLGAGAGPYNYSDMTGSVSTIKQGVGSIIYDGGALGTEWGTVTWNQEPEGSEPGGTQITFEARAADSQAALSSVAFVPVANGVEFTMTGRFIEVRTTLKANAAGDTPIVSDVTITPKTADLSIVKTGPALVQDGGSATYTLTVANDGPANATGVVVTDTLPAGTTYVSGSAGCSEAAGVVTCTVGMLAAGSSTMLSITVDVDTDAASITDTATVTGDQDDPDEGDNTSSFTSEVNHAPDCSGVFATTGVLWPPNHSWWPITLMGVTDPDGDPVSVTVTGITQDEPVNAAADGNTSPDATITPLQVRAERAGTGDGRVYRIAFTADDGTGGSCSGYATVSVPHDMGAGATAVDSAPPSYDSTTP